MNTQEISEQLQQAKEILQACEEVPTDKFLTCKEYNTLVMKIIGDTYNYNNNKKEYDILLSKIFNISIIEVEQLITVEEIKKEQRRRIEEISKPLTNKPLIN